VLQCGDFLTVVILILYSHSRLTFGFPALVAYSLDKGAYTVMRGSFNEKKTTSFLHGVTSGRQPTIKLSKIPEIVTVEPWDGEDAAPMEDEIPLSEIMGWDDEDDAEEKKESEDEL
jgi:protein disulfide-isomerase A6